MLSGDAVFTSVGHCCVSKSSPIDLYERGCEQHRIYGRKRQPLVKRQEAQVRQQIGDLVEAIKLAQTDDEHGAPA
jgi:hypothetical protein